MDEEVTLPRLSGFAEYWKDSPPVNELVAQVFSAEKQSEPSKPEELLDLIPRV